jgi:HlyD family secretion protein
MSRRHIIILLLILAFAAGLYGYWRKSPTPDEEQYITATVDQGDIRKVVSANGTLNPVVLVNVGTQVSGTLQRLYADFNDRVKAGQVLAELDPSLFRAALDQSQANLANAKASLQLAEANVSRAQALFEKGYIARAEWDQAVQVLGVGRAQVAAASASVRRDETNLRYSVIVSPVSGIVVSRSVDVGQTVAASFQTPTLFTIAENLKRMQIDTTVAEADVGGIRVGQSARFTVDAFAGREFSGTVRQIRLNSQILQNVVSYNVVIDVDNPDEALLPGMTAFVNIGIDQRTNVLRIPLSALRFRPEEAAPVKPAPPTDAKSVYRLEQGKPVAVIVQVGLTDSKMAEVLPGPLRVGDILVVDDLKREKPSQAGGGGGGFKMRMF